MDKSYYFPIVYRFSFSIALMISSIFISYGQSKEAKIKDIRSLFQKINSDNTLKVIKLENEDIPGPALDNGQSLTAFYKGNTIYKIQAWVGLSYAIREYEFYLKDSQVFFVYEKESDFPSNEAKATLDHSKTVVAFEARYYLYQNKIIDVKSKGKKRFEGTSVMSAKDLLTIANNYLAIIKSRLKIKK